MKIIFKFSNLEHLWFYWKKKLEKLRYSTVDEFKRFAKREWNSINIDVCRKLVDSMKRREASLILNEGKITKY